MELNEVVIANVVFFLLPRNTTDDGRSKCALWPSSVSGLDFVNVVLQVPDYIEGTPCESGTEGCQYDFIAGFQAVFIFVET